MPRFRFGTYVLESETGVLEQAGELVDLRPKLVETLTALVESAPNVVPKDELVRRIWPDTHVVESALQRNISELRQRFTKDYGERAVIETVSKRGYRFAIPVIRESDPEVASPEVVTALEPQPDEPPPTRKPYELRVVLIGGALLLAFALVVLAALGRPRKDSSEGSEQLARSRDQGMRAFRAGFSLYDQWTAQSIADAEVQFRRTAGLLPDDWFGYYGLSAALLAERVVSGAGFAENSHEVRRVSELAVHFGPQVAVTHSVRGAVLLLLDWNWREAEREIEAGVRWNPKNHVPLAYRGALRLAEGLLESATEDFDAALTLSPKYDEAFIGKALARYYAGDFAVAASLLKECLAFTKKKQAALRLLSIVLGAQGHFAEAGRTLEEAQLPPWQKLQTEAWLAARAGDRDTAIRLRAELESACRRQHLAFCDSAAIDVELGRTDAAFASLEEAVRIKHWKALFLKVDPLLKPLHSHPRWARILAQVAKL